MWGGGVCNPSFPPPYLYFPPSRPPPSPPPYAAHFAPLRIFLPPSSKTTVHLFMLPFILVDGLHQSFNTVGVCLIVSPFFCLVLQPSQQPSRQQSSQVKPSSRRKGEEKRRQDRYEINNQQAPPPPPQPQHTHTTRTPILRLLQAQQVLVVL